MIKFIISTVIAVMIACIYSYGVSAKVTNLVDYEWKNPNHVVVSETTNCEQICSGYSDYITYCPQGYSLVTCPDARCSEFKKCVYQ